MRESVVATDRDVPPRSQFFQILFGKLQILGSIRCSFEYIDVTERIRELTVDLVLGARGKMHTDSANGPEDMIVTEMLKELPMYEITKCFQRRCRGECCSPTSWQIVKGVFGAGEVVFVSGRAEVK